MLTIQLLQLTKAPKISFQKSPEQFFSYTFLPGQAKYFYFYWVNKFVSSKRWIATNAIKNDYMTIFLGND